MARFKLPTLKQDRTFNSRECATVLAALRFWQEHLEKQGRMGYTVAEAVPSHFDHFEEEKPLTAKQIDNLCLTINLGFPETTTRPQVVVVIEGSLVQEVLSNVYVEYAVVDYDTDGVDEDEVVNMPQTPDGDIAECIGHTSVANVMPERVAEMFAAFD